MGYAHSSPPPVKPIPPKKWKLVIDHYPKRKGENYIGHLYGPRLFHRSRSAYSEATILDWAEGVKAQKLAEKKLRNTTTVHYI